MKTINDILREMRNPKSNCPEDEKYEVAYSVADLKSILKNYSNRIEAAVKILEADRDNWRRQALDEDARANAATCKDSLQVGNTAKLREVVRELLDTMYDMGIDEEIVAIAIESPNCHTNEHPVAKVIKKAKAALAAPPEPKGNNAKMRSELYGLASWIWELTGSAMARERGIVCSEVRNIAARIETIADNGDVK